jgi:hypothetical protein
LDVEKLRAFGLTKARMKDCNALFFYQLLFPIGNPNRSGVESDGRMSYFTKVTGFTNIYGASKFGMAGTYGNKFKWRLLKRWSILMETNVKKEDGHCRNKVEGFQVQQADCFS